MADNVIDTLSIKIESSSSGVGRSVGSVIDHLKDLERYLNKFSSSVGSFGSAMDSIAKGLVTLDTAISKIDVGRLEKTSNALSSLSLSAKKLNGAFGNIGMDKAARDAKALETQMDKTVKSFMKAGMISPEVGDKVKDLFSKFASGVSFKDGAFKDVSDEGFAAYEDMIRLMMSNTLKKAQDEIDYTTRQIVEYVNSNKAKVSLPFTISDIDVGNAFNKNPKELLANVFGVGNWTTTGKGDMNLKEFIDGFNQSTGMNLNADETQQAFMALANAVLTAKEQIREFDSATADTKVDMDSVFQDMVQMTSGMRQFESSLRATSAQINGNPFEQLAQGLQSLTTVGSIPDLTGVAAIAESISKLGYKNALAGIANLPVLVQGLQSLNQLGSINVPDLTGLAKFIEVISTLGYKKANNATANLRPLIDGVRELATLNGLEFPTEQIASLASSFSMLGRETTGKAVANIPQLAQAFKQLMQTLSTAPKVNSSVIALANAMAKLSASGAKVGSASRSLQGSLKSLQSTASPLTGTFKKLGTGVLNFCKRLLESVRHTDTASSKYNTLASKVGLLYAKYWALMRIVGIFNKITGAASSLIEVQNVVDTTFGKMSYKIEDFAKNAIKNFGMSELSAKQTASQFQAMGTAMGITGQQVANAQRLLNTKRTMEGNVAGYDKASKSMADMSINLTKLSADMASFYDIEQSTVAKALQSGVLAGQTRPLRQYGLDLTNATLAEWAMKKNGLDANIKSMTQAEKTMLRYQYVMANSTMAQQDFQRTQGTWHNQLVILKQQLQQLAVVIGSGLIQAIKPFVMQMNSALSAIIQFAQNVVNALGKIFGWEMDINTKGLTIDDDALEDVEDLAQGLDDAGDSADSTSKSVKKLKDQLQGFDKLNVLRTTEKTPSTSTSKNKNDKNGSGATSGNGLVSGGDVSSALKKTKSKFESEIDDLYGLGQYIADKIKKALQDIHWDDVYSAAEKWGEGLANFLNGIVDDKDLFSEIGTTVANGINTALTFLDSFGKTFHWDNFGASLAASLTSFLKNLNWKKALSAAKNWGSGIGRAIASFIKENDFKEVGKAVANAIKTVITFWLSLGSEIPWKDLGQKLADTINGAIENFPAKELADTIDVWVQGIYDMLVAALKDIKWDKLRDKIKEFIENLDFKTVKIILAALAIRAIRKIVFSNVVMEAIKKALLSHIALKLKEGLSLTDLIFKIKNIAWTLPGTPAFDVGATALLEKLWDSIYKNLPKSWSDAYDKLDKFIKEDLIGGFFGLIEKAFSFENTKDWWDKAREDFKKGGIYIIKGIGEGLVTLLSFITEPITTVCNAIFTKFCELFGISSPAEKMKPIGKYIIEGIFEGFKLPDFSKAFEWVANKFSDLKTKLENKTSEIKTSIGTKWGEIKTSIGEKVDSIKTTVGNKWDTIKSTVSNKMSTLQTNIGNVWSEIKSTAESRVPQIKDAAVNKFSSMKTSIENAFKGVGTSVSNIWKDVHSKTKNKLTEIRNSVVDKFNGLLKKLKDVFPLALGKLFQFKLPTFEFDTKTLQLANLTITYPSGVRAKWNKKAYDNPLMFMKPTVVPTMAGLQGFGDGNGGEMVYGHANLMNDIREASGNGEMTAIGNRQLANDQRIIQLLSIIAQKEFGVSSDTLFRSVRDQAQNYTNRTGKQAFEF